MAHSFSEITQESQESLFSSLDAYVNQMHSCSSNPQDFMDNLRDSQEFLGDDEIVNNAPEPDPQSIHVSETFEDGTRKSQDYIEAEREARAYASRGRTAPRGRAVTAEDINNMGNMYNQSRRRATAQSYQSNQDFERSYAYSSGSYVDATGKHKKSRVYEFDMNNQDFNTNQDPSQPVNPVEAIENLRALVTKAVSQTFGFSRITEIVVSDSSLIINGVQFQPKFDRQHINPETFPIDTLSYIEAGAIAGFFDWGMLRKMKKLKSFSIDDRMFYISNVADDLGIGRRIGVSSIFKVVPSLEFFSIGGSPVTKDTLNKPASIPAKKKVREANRGYQIMDDCKISILGTTSWLQNYCLDSFKTYATNRGNRGFIRFALGMSWRGYWLYHATRVNLVTHVIGGAVTMVADAFKPASVDDLT